VNLARCTPADEIKKVVGGITDMTMQKKVMDD